MAATMVDKAVKAFADGRVRVVKGNSHGIALDVVASKPDTATLHTPTYRTVVYEKGRVIQRTCSCPCPKRCYHMTAAEMLWRPEGENR